MTRSGPDRVIDASVALKWVLSETGSDAAAGLLDGRRLYAPWLIHTEAANALWVLVRRGSIAGDGAQDALNYICNAPFTASPPAYDPVPDALRLARLIGHPVYDCVYLSLALAMECPVVTADRRFAEAAHRVDETAPFVERLT